MNKVIKVELFLTTFGYFFSGIYMQDNIMCSQIDFNKVDSILKFEPCLTGNEFTTKSYSEELLDPFRPDSENYLSNISPGWSCFSTIESFSLDEDTEFYSAIYLQSGVVDDASFIDIQVFDMESGSALPVINTKVSRGWNEFYSKFDGPVENAKVYHT